MSAPSRRPTLVLPRRALLAVLLAALPWTVVPAASASDVLFALTQTGELLSVRSDVPGVPTKRVRLQGLPDGSVPLALDSRPSDGALVLAAKQGPNLVLHRVNPATGETARLAPGAAPIGATTADAAMDFSPDGRTVRLVTTTGAHLLVDAATGAATALPALAYPPGSGASKLTPRPIGLGRLPQGWILVADAAWRKLSRLGDDANPPDTGLLAPVGTINFPIERDGALTVSPADGRVYLAIADKGEDQSNLYSTAPDPLLPAYTGPFPDKDTVVGLAVGAGGLFDLDRPLYRVREADGSVQLTVQRSGTTSAPADVAFDVQDETATSGADFPATAGILAFAAGQTAAHVDLPVIADGVAETEEQLKVRLTDVGGPAGFGFRRQAKVAIVDSSAAAAQGGASRRPAATRPAGAAKPAKQATTSPRPLSLVVSAPRLRRIGRTLRIPFRCSTRCRVVVEAKLDRRSARSIRRPAVLGRGTRTLTKAGRGAVTIRIARWSKRLRKVRRGTIQLTVKGYGEVQGAPKRLRLKVAVRR